MIFVRTIMYGSPRSQVQQSYFHILNEYIYVTVHFFKRVCLLDIGLTSKKNKRGLDDLECVTYAKDQKDVTKQWSTFLEYSK